MRRAIAPGLVAATKLVLSLGLFGVGFRAVSDDDYARVTIAQEFALHPRLDPTGTSWLPLPFWVYGGAMKVFGPSLATAQVTALLLGICAAVGMWFAARSLTLTARAALFGSLIAAVFTHAAYYGVAAVPDYPTAVVAFAACATLNRSDGAARSIGAALAAAATLCRYETWPIAFVVMGYALLDAIRRPHQRRGLIASAVIAPSGAIAWMIHGVIQHHDALFFLKRVSAYRRALGGEAIPLGTRLLKQPLSLISGEPELLSLLLGLGAALLLLHGWGGLRAQGWKRPTVACASLVAFLLIGDLLDGAPTHHEDRTLLVAWLGLSLLAGAMTDRLLLPAKAASSGASGQLAWWKCFLTPRAAIVGILVLVGFGGWLRPTLAKREPFVDRSGEVAIGKAAALTVPAGARLAIYTQDYGYFAIQSAIARPADTASMLRRDPRHHEQDPLSSPEAMQRRLDALGAAYIIVPERHLATALPHCRSLTQTSGYALLVR